jgi:putative GTP pyrophosphokinase
VARRPSDLLKPPVGKSYSKEAVNRAGRLLAEMQQRTWDLEHEARFEPWGPRAIVEAYQTVTWWREQHAAPLSTVGAGLRYHVKQEHGLVDDRVDVTQRLKRRRTMIGKLNREPGMKLARMEDIAGVRVRLPSLGKLQALSRRLQKTWTIHRVRDYIDKPKASGYRAQHLIVKRRGRLVEVQLRTVRQDTWANQVEDDGRQLAVDFKFGEGDDNVHAYYRVVAEAFAILDRDEGLSPELEAVINERYQEVRQRLGRRPPSGST